MNKTIEKLKPEAIWRHFAAICQIPRPSSHEEAIRKYVIGFAKANKLECLVDSADNVIIRKPATKGMEDRKGIILQSHLDMVPQKNSDKKFDFLKDPIEAYVDGEWVTANGTTLGADNGIGIAATLAALEDKELAHGAIEGLFTATEETGMDGAFGLKAGVLKGDILMNLDSETEGELYVGCAGGVDINVSLKYKQDKASYGEHKALEIDIRGLRGGHSGMEIILQRANANKIMFRFLRLAFHKYDLQLASIDGGSLRNAIPREAVAVVLVPAKSVAEFKKEVAEYEKLIVREFKGIEDAVSIKCKDADKPASVIDKQTAARLTNAICGVQNGVITMSTSMEGLVQTSSNLARVVSQGGEIKMQCLLRSSVNSEKDNLAQNISAVFELAGAKVDIAGGYDGWQPNMESPILKSMKAGYRDMYGKEPAVMAIHAGLECGIIGGVYPNLDMISFGPTIRYPHSPDEEVNIASVGKFWDFLKYTLANAPKR